VSVTCYGHWSCPYATRVQWALAQRGIEHEVFDVPPSAVRPKDFVLPALFVQHSPRLEVPLLRIGDAFLADSIPVLRWLDEAFPHSALGGSGERVAWLDAHLFPAMLGVSYGVRPEDVRRASDALAASLDVVARWLAADGPWLGGAHPSIADAIVVPLHVRLEALRRLGFDGEVPALFERHGAHVRAERGWSAVAWTDAQVDEHVGRFAAYRRRRAAV